MQEIASNQAILQQSLQQWAFVTECWQLSPIYSQFDKASFQAASNTVNLLKYLQENPIAWQIIQMRPTADGYTLMTKLGEQWLSIKQKIQEFKQWFVELGNIDLQA